MEWYRNPCHMNPNGPRAHGPMGPWGPSVHGPMDRDGRAGGTECRAGPWEQWDPWAHGPKGPRAHGPQGPWVPGPMDRDRRAGGTEWRAVQLVGSPREPWKPSEPWGPEYGVPDCQLCNDICVLDNTQARGSKVELSNDVGASRRSAPITLAKSRQ